MKFKTLAIVSLLMYACGTETHHHYDKKPRKPDSTEEMRKQIMQLQMEIQSLVESNYATCSASLSQAAQNICKIAQAATIEARTEMQGALADLASQLEEQVKDTQADVAALAAVWKKIYGVDFPETSGAPVPTEADCVTFTGNASIMECVKVQGSAIDAIQAAIDDLLDTVSDAATQVAVGQENISAGPVYEFILRMGDQARINAYANGLQEAIVLGSNPLTATAASPTIAVASTAHGLTVGNFVRMSSCQSGKGFTAFHLNRQFEVLTTPTVNSFTIATVANASSGGAFGGTTCLIQRYTGNGFTTIWTNLDGSDVAVRKTSSGSRAYNFAICQTTADLGKICYDQTSRTATFATISAIPGWDTTCASSGNVLCK